MSRLIVQNLPPYATKQRLLEHFERRDGPGGSITDVRVALTSDGRSSRGFGFVGFKTDAEAQKARDWFDRTYVGSTRIRVSVVDGTKDAPAPRPNKRPRTTLNDTARLSLSSKSAKGTSGTSKPPTAKEAELDQYMQVMRPRTKRGPAWTNDESAAPRVVPTFPDTKSSPSQDAEDEHDDEWGGIAPDEPQNEITDMEWFQQRVSHAVDITKAFDQSDEEMGAPAPEILIPSVEIVDTTTENPDKATILSTSRLFVRNLAFSCTNNELRQIFEPYGPIAQVHLPQDTTKKIGKGFGYVTFAQANDALAAYEALDKRSFQGRLLHILPAVDKHLKPEDDRAKTLKAKRSEDRKTQAGREFNWAMLYMNSDAVASSVAARLNVSKSDILNPDSGESAAVKLALAETHIITETKTFLESQGCDLSAFSPPEGSSSGPRRSDTVILVKNIPFGTAEQGIRALFEPHGDIRRVIVPPAGTMAIVEFERAEEASKAFRAVAYRRLGNSVVYLEKAPIGLLPEGDLVHTAKTGEIQGEDIPTNTVAHPTENETNAPGTTVFVKNLAFATTSDQLTSVLRHLPGYSFARVQTKPDPKDPAGSNRLSMGYGFVGFKDVDSAKRGLKALQGMLVDGHALEAKFAGRGTEEDVAMREKESGLNKGGRRTTKMIVKNVPFEANKKDIRELFGVHGQLKSCRVPKRFDHRSRGFAFLEFLTRQDAEAAYSALRHTHLLGRHLVLEWAEEEQDLDVLRMKAGVGLGKGDEMPGRKRKLEMGGDADGPEEDMDL